MGDFTFIPDSDYVSKFSYNSDTEQLTVRFKRGKQVSYVYDKVPLQLYGKLKVADSPGQFFRNNIRDNYKGNELWQPQKKKT